MLCIALDAMGGDFAPSVCIEGALSALDHSPHLRVILTGDERTLKKELEKHGPKHRDRLEILHASDTISMEDHAASVIRKKKDSSIHLGLKLVKEGKAQAFLSAGNSGAVMAGSLLLLGRLPTIDRPAILLRMPTAEGHVLILDGGANVDCEPSHLVQFAEMGSLYANRVESIENPRVALLANGSETHKGNELTREAHEVLKEKKNVNYIGYVEGFDLFRGTSDVVVCDGFVGNVILKACEGLSDTTFRWFRAELKRDPLGLLGLALMQRVLKKFRSKFDYQPYGAAPLLGINGVVLISHGSSTAVAISNGILTAEKSVGSGLVAKMALVGSTKKGRKD